MENNEVRFEVLKIERANKPGHVVVTLKFKNSEKLFTYVRKMYVQNGIGIVVIDGCHVNFTLYEYKLINIVKKYETKGMHKAKGGTSDKIKTKSEGKLEGIIFPNEIPQEIPKVEADENGEVHHERYEDIKTCLLSGIPVYLAGPAGSGKNHTVEQIANELGWNFYFSNSVQQEYKLTGFIDAGGKFHETEFYKACTDGKECIFFLDEMDASIPEVLVLLNAAIANGYFEFPNGRVDFDHVHFVAAGNTVGSGADDMYTGRMVLDQATLDRFAIIEFDYSMRIEMAITKNNSDLVEFIHQLRKDAQSKGIRATFSYRCMTMVTKLEKQGMDLQMIIKIAVVKGLDKDTINTFNPMGYTKYHQAFRKVQMAA